MFEFTYIFPDGTSETYTYDNHADYVEDMNYLKTNYDEFGGHVEA